MHLLRAAAVALAAALALTGCSDDDPPDPPASPSASGTPTAPSSSATATAQPTQPALPEAATKATEAGARAFIAYYWDLINYAQVTGDVKALKKVSGPNCDGCQKGVEAVNELYESGGRAEGGAYELDISTVREVMPKNGQAFGIEAKYEVRNAPQTIIRGNGTTDVSEPGSTTFLSYLIWTASAWRTDILDPR